MPAAPSKALPGGSAAAVEPDRVMSAIAGIIRFDGGSVAPADIARMTAAMDYRAPDGIAHWCRGPVALGHGMLRTTQEAVEETQPLANDDESLVLVMDGWLDNAAELRTELVARGSMLRGRADAELVLRAYEAWGAEACLDRIDGDFAFVIWDARRQQAFCARDRVGNKPFFYHWSGRALVFASAVAAVVSGPAVPRRANETMIAQYLANQWLTRDETLWRGVVRLPPATAMRVSAGGPVIRRYWRPDPEAALPCVTDADYFAYYRGLFEECVRRTSRSHRPLAVEVSGGLDSSAVMCMADRLRRSGRLEAPGLAGFTLSFDDPNAARDLPFARAVARHTGMPVEEVPPTLPALAAFEDYARRFCDFPGYPNAAMFAALRARAAAAGCRVVLTGEGGDEYLAGSHLYYAEELRARAWPRLAAFLRHEISTGGWWRAARRLLGYGVLPHLPEAVAHRVHAAAAPRRKQPDFDWLVPQMAAIVHRLRDEAARRPQPQVARAGQRLLQQALDDPFSDLVMEQAERFAALAGVELRYPMRSRRFIEAAFATPERLRLRAGVEKFIHVRALAAILPPELAARRDKAEFSVVFRSRLQALRPVLAAEIPARRAPWVNGEGMRRAVAAFDAKRGGALLWTLWSVYGCDVAVPRNSNMIDS